MAIQDAALKFGPWNFSGAGAWDLELPEGMIPSKTAKNLKKPAHSFFHVPDSQRQPLKF
jgi:hypothetical protein